MISNPSEPKQSSETFAATQVQETSNRLLAEQSIGTTGYDKFAAFLTSSIFVLGSLVLLGLGAWLMQFDWETRRSIPVVGGEDLPPIVNNDPRESRFAFDEPNVAFASSDEMSLPESLQVITTAVSNNRVQVVGYGERASQYNGDGLKGEGEDEPYPGPYPGPPVISEATRWKITYLATSRKDYLRQLEHFGIELGALSRTTARIDLVSSPASAPKTSNTTRKDEKRLYFSHTSRRFKRWDQRTAEEVGIANAKEKICVQFIPEDARVLLRQAEAEHLEKLLDQGKERTIQDVKKTFFKVRETSDGFEFYVDRIEFIVPDEI